MVVFTHWYGADNGGTRGDQGLYRLPPEHVRTINCEFSYHELVSGGIADAGNATIKEVVGSACSGYTRDNSGVFIRIDEG